MTKRISLLVVVTLIFTMIFTGCGTHQNEVSDNIEDSNTSETEKNDISDEKEVELRIAWWGSQERHNRTIEAIEMFEDKYPNISIESEFTGWDGYWEKIAAQAAAGNLPDVFQQSTSYVKQYVSKGLLLNLDPFVESQALDMSNVDENILSSGKLDDKLYALTLGMNCLFIAYDPALFEKAGVAEPAPGWTWEDYMDKAREIHEKLGLYGDSSIPGGYFEGLRYYLRQHGEKLYSEDGAKLGYEDDKLFEDFFAMELELVKEGVLPLPEVRLEVKSPEDELLITEKAAMASGIHSNSNQIIAMVSAANRPIEMMIFPKDKEQVQEGHYLKPSMFFSVANSTKHPDEAVKFIDYFTNDIEANKAMLAERGVPISSEVREALMPLLEDTQKQMFDYIDLAIEHSGPGEAPEPAGHPEVENLLNTLQEQILFEEITPADAAVKFRKEANQILAKSAQ